MKNKILLPGEHISSQEEGEAGENTYVEKDEIYSAAAGILEDKELKKLIKHNRKIEKPHLGMEVCCIINKTSTNKALVSCITYNEVTGNGREMVIDAALPVTAVDKRYVEDMRREVKVGDIIFAKIDKLTKTGVDISILGEKYGIISAFCPKCRAQMAQREGIFICSKCGWKERRKIAKFEMPVKS